MFGLTPQELAILRPLKTPAQIQDFLDSIPMNHEKEGETHWCPRRVLKENKAHCIEGALLAATALWLHGEDPIILDLKGAPPDYDHVVALYKRNGYWGAISKTNHATIRFRDPVYKTIRELVLSYFHEWFMNVDGKKTLLSYSRPFNMKKLGTAWVTREDDWWELDDILNALPHFPLVPKGNQKFIRDADAMELKAGRLIEWGEKNPRT